MDVHYTLDLTDLTDIYRTFHPHFSQVHKKTSSIDRSYIRLQGRTFFNTTFKKVKNIYIISIISSNRKDMKLKINYRRKADKFMNT